MANELVPTTRTPVTLQDYARAVVRAWDAVSEEPCTKGAVGVLWGQYVHETGGRNCWNWNIGNVKKVDGDGYDFHYLKGVWEGATPAVAAKLIASGQATPDPSVDHAKAVGPGRVSILFNPPHPASRFRAFPSLEAAMRDHLVLLAKKRFATAWPSVLAGDVVMFARALKARGYFTASEAAYAAGMKRPFAEAMASNAFDLAARELTKHDEDEDVLNGMQIIHPWIFREGDDGDDVS